MTVAGITIDRTTDLDRVVNGLDAMPSPMTTRIVFDEGAPATAYRTAVQRIGPVSAIMGELLDSAYVKSISTAGYLTRARSYLATLGLDVDTWEVGNEVNGNWLGAYADVAAKISGAFDVFHGAGKQTALTLYYNPNNVDGARELTPVAFSERYVPESMRHGLDYVWLSYYEQDFRNYRPTAQVVTDLCEQLHGLYPDASIGFGEVGLRRPVSSRTRARAESIMAYYYGLNIPLDYYVGGCFWWYGHQDVLGRNASMTQQFRAALATL